jgi:hypothetical protein
VHDRDYWGLPNGDVLQSHVESECDGFPCPLHSPSDHALRDAPLNWRQDRYLMERVCPCGVGHPDPDHLARIQRVRGEGVAWGQGVHGCCSRGCCRG